MPKISSAQRAAARQRLIDATIEVAHRDGVDGLTTRAITAEAGVSAGMFYGHFASKEALLAAVVDQKIDELTTLVTAEVDLGSPVDNVARDLLRQLVVVLDLRPLAVFRTAGRTADAKAAHQAINARIVEAFTPILQLAIDSGLVRPDVDVDAVIEFIDVVIDGLNRRRDLDGFVSTDDRVSTVAVDAIEHYLLAPRSA